MSLPLSSSRSLFSAYSSFFQRKCFLCMCQRSITIMILHIIVSTFRPVSNIIFTTPRFLFLTFPPIFSVTSILDGDNVCCAFVLISSLRITPWVVFKETTSLRPELVRETWNVFQDYSKDNFRNSPNTSLSRLEKFK